MADDAETCTKCGRESETIDDSGWCVVCRDALEEGRFSRGESA